MTLDKILVATDFSEPSELAIAQAADIASRLDAELVLLRVDSRLRTGRQGARGSTTAPEQPADERRAECLRRLEELAAPWVAEGVRVSLEVRGGHADEVIVEVAAELGADLVVTGTRGRTGLKRFLLGSVAEKVVRLSSTNVLVARRWASEEGRFNRIMVPTDFSPASEKALRLALLIAPPGATIDLFHAWQFPPGTHAHGSPDDDDSPLASLRREILKSANKNADTWLDRYSGQSVPLRFVHGYGPAAGVVQDRVVAEKYDLVAMGTHGYRGFRRFVLGSVAEAIVRYSPCSVMIAHAEDVEQSA